MKLLPKQPISLLHVDDNCFTGQGAEETFRTKHAPTDYVYVQWTIDGNAVPTAATHIQLYTEGGVLAYDLGLYVNQTTNKNWFTLKFKLNDLGLGEGCYYLQWNDFEKSAISTERSNVFFVTSLLDCTKKVVATCDCYGHGFDWSVFALQWRVPFAKFNPEYDLFTDDDLDSDGSNTKFYAEHDKHYSIRTDAMNEGAHDALSCMLLCDTVLVDDVEYYLPKKEYGLDNDKDGKTLLFNAEFVLKPQNFITTNNNCKDCDEENYPYYG